MICPKCGAQNMDGVTFCGNCGGQLLSYSPITPEEPQQNENYSQQQPPLYGNSAEGNSNYRSSVNPSGSSSDSPTFPPKNYMTESIIVTVVTFLCCCSPISIILGIIAIVKANSVNSEFARGNYEGANSNANSAKKLTIWAAIVAVITVVLVLIFYVLIFASKISEMGGWQELLDSMN